MSELRVLLADDHALMRAGLRALIQEMAGVAVVGEAADGAEALRQIGELRPDIALVDISMPRLNGLEVVARAAASNPRVRVVILSMYAFEEYVRRALLAGAAGYLLKSAGQGELNQALQAVARGEPWLSPPISRMVVAALGRSRADQESSLEQLSMRQREILQLVAEGHSTKDVAALLDVSVKTVETHRTELMRRLGIHGVAGLVRYAIRVRLVDPES